MPRNEERAEQRNFRREVAARQAGAGSTVGNANDLVNNLLNPQAAESPAYNFSTDLGQYGNPNYNYQVGDEFSNPGPEPPRDSPEWPQWKAHKRAWQNFIGGRQQYVNQMIGIGYNPEDLGIFNQKEEGMAGYRRLMQPGVIDQLRQQSANWMRNSSDAEIDPTTGFYRSGNSYYDQRGMRVGAGGRPAGGFYGMENTMGQFGAGSVPRSASNYQPNRPARPNPGAVSNTGAQTTQSAPIANRVTPYNYGGFGQAFGAGSIPTTRRNRAPQRVYRAPSPFGI